MKRTSFVLLLALGAMAFTLVADERDASACGGCFTPPTPEDLSVVTDHRMVLTVTKGKSTLYDQIRYSGSPSSFAWVLPIAGTVDIGLSSDLLFTALERNTQVTFVPPPQNCPAPPSSCYGGDDRSSAASSSSSSGGFGAGAANGSEPSPPPVTVLEHEVVGPYETVQLSVANGNTTALTDWLSEHGYAVSDDVKPVIAAYVGEQFNFLALKLVPGQGVKDMRPVRITSTTPGASAVLPLRMVAAGTGATVGITLWVVAEGRYEPQNFPSFVIQGEDLTWDWNLQSSDLTEVRAAKTAAGNGRIWEIETSAKVYRGTIESVVRAGTWDGQGKIPVTDEEKAEQNYLAVKDGQGNTLKTAAEVRDEDLATLFDGISPQYGTARITRLRADLSHAALDQDLQMTASANQNDVSSPRQIVKEKNQPLCPVYDGDCRYVGTLPRDQAIARANAPVASGSGSSCAVTTSSTDALLAASLGILGLAFVRTSRRRRAR